MSVEKELTYGEVIKARRTMVLSEYASKVEAILRNYVLAQGDIVDGLLTESFFNRHDRESTKIKLLNSITEEYAEKLKDI